MISFENVSLKHHDRYLIHDISFSINKGEKAVIYGKSGSGKTTILLTLVGARIPTSGTIFFAGKPVSPETIADIRRSIGFVMQEPDLGAPTVKESLLVPFTFSNNKGHTPSHGHIQQILEKLNLSNNILSKPAAIISGGEKQRLAVARSLLLDKKVYVLDEVTSALDKESKKALLDLFSKPEFTIISVSHDPAWFSICSKAICLSEGKITSIGAPSRIE